MHLLAQLLECAQPFLLSRELAGHHVADVGEAEPCRGRALQEDGADGEDPERGLLQGRQLRAERLGVLERVQRRHVLQLVVGEGQGGLRPVQPLEVRVVQLLRQAEAVVDRHEVERLRRGGRAAVGALEARRILDEDVAGMAVDVEEADVEDPDPVHGSHREPRRAQLAGVVLVRHEALDRRHRRRRRGARDPDQRGRLHAGEAVVVEEEGGHLPQHGPALVPTAARRRRPHGGHSVVVERLDDRDVLASAASFEQQRPAEAVLRGDEPGPGRDRGRGLRDELAHAAGVAARHDLHARLGPGPVRVLRAGRRDDGREARGGLAPAPRGQARVAPSGGGGVAVIPMTMIPVEQRAVEQRDGVEAVVPVPHGRGLEVVEMTDRDCHPGYVPSSCSPCGGRAASPSY